MIGPVHGVSLSSSAFPFPHPAGSMFPVDLDTGWALYTRNEPRLGNESEY